MIYIDEDGKAKMAKDAPGVIQKLLPEAVEVESAILQQPEVMLRIKGRRKRKNRVATAICGKNVNGPVLICRIQLDDYGELEWVGMSAEEAGRWVGKLVKIKRSLK